MGPLETGNAIFGARNLKISPLMGLANILKM